MSNVSNVIARSVGDLTSLVLDTVVVNVSDHDITVQVSTYKRTDEEALLEFNKVLAILGGKWKRRAFAYQEGCVLEGAVEARAERNGVPWRVWTPLADHTYGLASVEVRA